MTKPALFIRQLVFKKGLNILDIPDKLLYDLPLPRRCQPISYEAVNCTTGVSDVVESVLQIICQKYINLDLSPKFFFYVFSNERIYDFE